VDVDLTGDQDLLRETTVKFIESAFPLGRVRERVDGKSDTDSEYRRQAADLGWFAMLVPETLGGGSVSDNGLVDAAVIGYARGMYLQPGEFVGTNVTAYALAREGTADQQEKVLAALLAGDAAATWAAAGPNARWEPGFGVRAEPRGDGFVLSGTKTLVQGADTSEWLLVTASGEQGQSQFLVASDSPGVSVHPLDAIDLTRRFCEVRFNDVALEPGSIVGEFGTAGSLVDEQLTIACVLTVAESTGAMDRDFAVALQYAKDRNAFGRPIGSFQAIKHLLADTSLMLEMSKAMALAAAEAVGQGQVDGAEMASMAKSFVGDCGIDLAQNCFQVFGGIGYTWEHDQHLYLRRLTADAALYGEPFWHRERLCQLSGI
jgi:alkylation response protein AidB-like acyl-CoA dehydrogenase